MKQTIFLFLAISLLIVFPFSTECNGADKVVSYITIAGPTLMPPNSEESYWAFAHYTDGTVEDVTMATTFSENSNYATMSGSILYSARVTSNKYGRITANYMGAVAYLYFCIDVNLPE